MPLIAQRIRSRPRPLPLTPPQATWCTAPKAVDSVGVPVLHQIARGGMWEWEWDWSHQPIKDSRGIA